MRLWVDDASALRWMAPGGCAGVRVLAWPDDQPLDLAAAGFDEQAPDVMVEAFGCEIALEFIAACARQNWANKENKLKPAWINLEYLSAESYVERCHAMPSPVQAGPLAGWTKWFFYPGFTMQTGGLLREAELPRRQAGFDRAAWLAARGIAWGGETLVSLFCYEPPALAGLLTQWAQHGLQGQPLRLLVAAGRAEAAVKAVLKDKKWLQATADGRSQLSFFYLDLLTQHDFDHLLWACDLNFVRGEDSAVRALWAGKPFVWQIYPQHDDAHQAKLNAFLDMLDAPPSLRSFHAAWNGFTQALPAPSLQAWLSCVRLARRRLQAQQDLTTQLIAFAAQKREAAP